jgi:hypothetical protein
VPQILKRNTFPRLDSGSCPVSIGWEHPTMNKIRVVIDSSPNAMFEDCCPLFTKLGRMIDFNGERNVPYGRKPTKR